MAKKLLDLCEKFFGDRDFYEVLSIPKTANEKQVKKAYHKLSLLVHPDRVEEKVKAEATEKFKVLGKIHAILSDNDKRKIYDETGEFDEDSDEMQMKNWYDYWRTLFKPITVQDINNYKRDYQGSELEIKDLKRAYNDSKGDMNYILEAVPFTNCEEEDRLRKIIEDLVEKEEVEKYDAFFKENEKKRNARRKKWAKEAKEAEEIAAKLRETEGVEEGGSGSLDDLALAIQNRNRQRAAGADNFFDSLIDKYSEKADKETRGSSAKSASSPSQAKKKKRTT